MLHRVLIQKPDLDTRSSSTTSTRIQAPKHPHRSTDQVFALRSNVQDWLWEAVWCVPHWCKKLVRSSPNHWGLRKAQRKFYSMHCTCDGGAHPILYWRLQRSSTETHTPTVLLWNVTEIWSGLFCTLYRNIVYMLSCILCWVKGNWMM